jgi:LCP family protein required for cell wall assembly
MSGPEEESTAGRASDRAARDVGTRLPWRGFWGRLLIAMVIVGVCTATTVAMIDRGFTSRVQNIPRIPDLRVAPAPPGGANYLIIGSDTREGATAQEDIDAFGSPEEEAGQRSDTMMVAHVEPGSQKTFVVSFPRDLMVDVPGLPGKSQINAAYASGGPQRVIETLRENFGIEINHYLEVDFFSFQEIVNTIGAVPVYIPDVVRDQESGLRPFPYGPGCYFLDGGTALAWVRSRYLEVYENEEWVPADGRSDLDRIGRQQLFIRKLAGIAIEKSLSDPFLGREVAETVISYLKADENLNRDDVNALLRAFKTVDVNDPTSVRFETLPVEAYPPDPDRLVASADADQVVEQLRTFGDNSPPPATVQPSDVSVKVVDTTGTNIGQGVVTTLAGQGFRATDGGARTKPVPITEIRYGDDQGAQAKALLAYFPDDAKLVPDASVKSGVTLVLGASFPGAITVPSTVATTAPTTVAGTPVTTAPSSPASTTTTRTPVQADLCPQ